MKIKSLLIACVAGGLMYGCQSEAAKTQQIADDMCGCFNKLKDSLPPGALAVFEKTAVSATPQATYTKEIQALPVETAQKINEALLSTGKPASPINDCLKELDKKYKTQQGTEQAMAQKMIDALKDKKGCEIMLALMRMNQKK